MKNLFRNLLGALLLAIPLLSGSCSKEQQPVPGGADADKAVLDLQIATIPQSATHATRSDDPVDAAADFEVIKTLRIIMLNDKGEVEFNKLIGGSENTETPQNPETGAEGGEGGEGSNEPEETLYPRPSDPTLVYRLESDEFTTGQKQVFVIANEASVGSFTYTKGESTQSGTSLKTLLDSFQPADEDTVEGEAGAADEAEDVAALLNSIWFDPNYDNTNSSNFPIPWTTYYETTLTWGRNSKTFYLVPVATKFEFRIVNEMQQNVKINSIVIESIADRNYLFAQVDEDQQSLKYDNTTLYWVDWLQRVSAASWNYDSYDPNEPPSASSNNAFNGKYGWIWHYQLPAGVTHSPKTFVTNQSLEGMHAVETGTDQDGETKVQYEPGVFESKIFYSHESHLKGDKEDQWYKLVLDLTNSRNERKTISFNITNLGELFRNTHVRLSVKLINSGDKDGIYAEIVGWTYFPKQQGTVQQE